MENANSFYSNEEEMMRDFGQKYEEEKKKIKKPVVLICGFTGSGKTAILQSILGKDIVPDDKIGHGEPATQEYDKYENQYIRVYDSKGLEPNKGEDNFIEETREFIGGLRDLPNLNDHIHVYWYVIQGSGARVTDTDLKIINTFPKESTVVLISKKNIAKPQQLDAITKKLIDSGIPNNRIIAVDESGEGMEKLGSLTEQIMPDAYKSAWNEAQKINLEKNLKAIKNKEDKAFAIIAGASIAAGAAGAIPIPVSDAPIITATQLGMIASLAALYKVPIQKEQVLSMLMPLVGRQLVTSLLKFVPVAGSIVSAGVAVTLTGGLGWFVQNQFEKIAVATAKGEEVPPPIFDAEMALNFIKNNKDLIESVTKK